jgi:uncharacterized protein YdaU (DUF1376 family)
MGNSMAEFPALPLWTDAYLGDTTHLTTIEHGAYLLLLMTAWRSRDCKLPDDDRLLARYARCSAGQWKRLRPILEPFFVVENGHWWQRRLTDEAVAVRRKKDNAAANGRASALKRQGRHSTERDTSVNENAAERQRKSNLTNNQNHTPLPNGNGGDSAKSLFDEGVALLVSKGRAESSARSVIAKFQKDFGDPAVLDAINRCRNATDPVSAMRDRLGKVKAQEEYYGP